MNQTERQNHINFAKKYFEKEILDSKERRLKKAKENFPIRVAFYYGWETYPWEDGKPPRPLWPENLMYYNVKVIESDNFVNEDGPFFTVTNREDRDEWFAYAAVCEVGNYRSYYQTIENEHPEWIVSRNEIWDSFIVDQAAPGWPQFFVQHVLGPLRARGFKNFFLDTLDSYYIWTGWVDTIEIQSGDDQETIERKNKVRQQQQGIANVIKAIKNSDPNTKLIFNRGFEIIDNFLVNEPNPINYYAYGLAAESLFQWWNHEAKRYETVGKDEYEWLYPKMLALKNQGLQVISIDYGLVKQRIKSLKIARRIHNVGFIPWITDGILSGPGLGLAELVKIR